MEKNVETKHCHFEDFECESTVSHVVVYEQRMKGHVIAEMHEGYCESHIEEALDFLGEMGGCFEIEDWNLKYDIYRMQQKEMA